MNRARVLHVYYWSLCLFRQSSPPPSETLESSHNRVAELEDEKGNLQLRLVEMEEEVSVKGQ